MIHNFYITGGFSSCRDAFDRGYQQSRILPIQIPGINTFDVSCDMATDGGGWIVIQRRMDATVDFYRGWNDYKVGFGNLSGNFWLGLEKIHKLAAPGKRAILRVDMKHMDFGDIKYAKYDRFEIAGEAEGYKMNVDGFRGNAGDSLSHHNGRKFSTYDRDNDADRDNCALKFQGAWWYGFCHQSNLNGLFPIADYKEPKYISWVTIDDTYGRVIFSEMKIRH